MSTPSAEVIVTLPVEGRFHYAIPPELAGALVPGHRVIVPFGTRRVTGFISTLDSAPPEGMPLKPILERLDEEPLLTADLLAIVTFAAEYYLAPAGEVLRVALPPGITAASIARHRLTAAGREALRDAASLTPAERALLEQLGAGEGKRKKEVSRELTARLVARGLVETRESIGAREVEELIEIAERTAQPVVLESFARAPSQRRLLERLEGGPTELEALDRELGRASVRRALKPLVEGGWVRISERRREDLPAPTTDHGSLVTPSPAQAAVIAELGRAIEARQRAAFLLRGVTGSGKTEVYLRAIAQARALGRGAIVLVPEIALTAQLEARFRARFGDQVAVLHSAISDAERRRRWQKLRRGEATIALGARSAVFAPVCELGVVVVDEEHDPSFKQHSDVRYNGRDLALLRAHRAGAAAVLGTATPSLETRHLVESGRLVELRLPERVAGRPLPEILVVNLTDRRTDRDAKGEIPLLTRPLADGLRRVVERGEQAILFLNRRGFNTVVICDECQTPRRCAHCDVSLTHHKEARALVCHHCGHQEPFDRPCASCKSRAMKPYGAGTERVAQAVVEAAPDARVLRLDRDVTSKAGALEDVLTRFRERRADVLVGTQMVTKGHDFPHVTLVGIICADSSLAFPDFRAAERTFQLLTQVAGRAGRAELPGRVVIQTFQPDHYALQCALTHDDDRFFRLEIESRRSAGYPPITRMALIRLEAKDAAKLARVEGQLLEVARVVASTRGVTIKGPVPAPIARIKERHRRMMMLMAPTPAVLVGALHAIRDRLPKLPAAVDLVIDVDPIDLL